MRLKNNSIINIRVSKPDKALLQTAAALERKSLSAFLRDCAETAARKVLGKPRLVRR